MTLKNKIISHIMNRISECSADIRRQEDMCKKFLVAPSSNRVYTSLVTYRLALTEILEEVRGINDNVGKGENF